MQENRLLNIGALIKHPPKGMRINDIRGAGGRMAENVPMYAFENDLPPWYFDESALGGVIEAAAECCLGKHVRESGRPRTADGKRHASMSFPVEGSGTSLS